MKNIREEHKYLLADETKALAFLATLMPDGSPQVTPLWFDVVDGQIWVNSAKGRVKDKNMRARPEVALTIMDLGQAYDYLQIRGHVVEVVEGGALAHIDRLSQKYRGRGWVENEGEVRVIYKIEARS